MKYIARRFICIQRIHRLLVHVCALVFLLSACGTISQYPGNSSVQTSGRDANPVLALAPSASPSTLTPVPTSSPVAPGVPGSPNVPVPPAPNQPAASPTATPDNVPPGWTSEEAQLQQRLFQQINRDRASAGLPPYTLNGVLSNGARQHDITMSGLCGMQHQCPGEPDPCQRISNEGISWTTCGENIGYTSPNPTAWAGVQQVDEAMLNELPPNDGHRQNLLSTSFRRVGVGIFIDARGTVWITEDFAN